MDKREYLVSIGLANPTRGRFSREAEIAWKKHIGDSLDAATVPVLGIDDDGNFSLTPAEPEPVKLEVAPLPTPPRLVRRKENMAYSITSGGHMVGHRDCGDCQNLIQYCACQDGPAALRWVRKEVEQKPYLVEA